MSGSVVVSVTQMALFQSDEPAAGAASDAANAMNTELPVGSTAAPEDLADTRACTYCRELARILNAVSLLPAVRHATWPRLGRDAISFPAGRLARCRPGPVRMRAVERSA